MKPVKTEKHVKPGKPVKKVARALFILKRRADYSTDLPNFKAPQVASGMFNSANFVNDMLTSIGYESKVVTILDNNAIDREVTQYKPTHVFIEGYWVVPEKFAVLKKLHPNVTWIVRCHSEIPFLSQEGNAMDWTFGYIRQGIMISANSPRMNADFIDMLEPAFGKTPSIQKVVPLLPNFYPTDDFISRPLDMSGDTIHVACFGAFRPLKNQLIQALAAIEFAEDNNKKLHFHINHLAPGNSYGPNSGANALKNVRALFANQPRHTLVEHSWASHEHFVKLLKKMHISMQVSLSETFNIVTADAMSQGTPVVVSSEIPYVVPVYASTTSSQQIAKTMAFVWKHRYSLIRDNKKRLEHYNEASMILWDNFLRGFSFDEDYMSELQESLMAADEDDSAVYKAWIKAKDWIKALKRTLGL